MPRLPLPVSKPTRLVVAVRTPHITCRLPAAVDGSRPFRAGRVDRVAATTPRRGRRRAGGVA